MCQFSFERLDLWQRGREFCITIYKISQKFPPDEVLNILLVAVDLNFIEESILNETRPIIEEISNKLNRLRESQLPQKT